MSSNKRKNVISGISIVVVFVLSAIYLFTPMVDGYNWLGWLIGILNLIAGPAVLIAYLNEVRKGVFKDVEEAVSKEE